MKYKIINKNTKETFEREASDMVNLKEKFFDELFDFERITEERVLKIHNQQDYKDVMLGYSKSYTIATDGCLLTCGTYLYNFYNGTNINPIEFNEKCKEAGVFFKNPKGDMCLIDCYKMAKVIGIEYKGKYSEMSQTPESMKIFNPTIKEVDYSQSVGKQQHFVIRVYDKNGNYILDPLGGVKREVNYYENKDNYEQWKKKYASYRVFTNKLNDNTITINNTPTMTTYNTLSH